MLENWIWNKDILKKVSKHYKTGEPLPQDLIEKKIATKNEYVATETLS
jgi:thimet oligopeptidase